MKLMLLAVQIVESSAVMVIAGTQTGQGDVGEAAEDVGAVERRRLVLLGGDGLHRGQEHHRVEGRALPDGDDDDRPEREVGIGQELDQRLRLEDTRCGCS